MKDNFHAPVRQIKLNRQPDGQDVVVIQFVIGVDLNKLAEIADACRKIEGANAVSISQPPKQRG